MRRHARQVHGNEADTAAEAPHIEDFGERPITTAIPGARRSGVRLGLSVPSGAMGAILVAASALGAAALAPLAFTELAGSEPHGQTAVVATAPASLPAVGSGDATPGAAEPTDKPEPTVVATEPPQPTATPTAKPTATPKPQPAPTKAPSEVLAISVTLKDGHPVVEWGSCDGLRFDAYKVVRSADSVVTWPLGKGDELFAVVGAGDARQAWDKHGPTGLKLWYRVFCVRATDAGYVVVRATAAKAIVVPAVEPVATPDPIRMGFQASLGSDGLVRLSWDACALEGSRYYKVVRSTTTDNPSYFPWTDGTELAAVLDQSGQTAWTDEAPATGGTTWYRVQCIGYLGDQKVLLGQTDAVAVAVP